ncbi:hypothetical protein MKX03_012602, partial [Papaver bracteatum]
METFGAGEVIRDDRVAELKAFDETKAGVKGIVDAGVVRVPRIFVRLPDEVASTSDIGGLSLDTRSLRFLHQ